MKISQISVFLENKNGRLAEVTRILAENGISLKAASIADTSDFGILRLICDQTEKARQLMHDHLFTTRINDVIAVRLDDRPGSLAAIMTLFEQNRVNVEYLYTTHIGQEQRSAVVFKVEDVELGLSILRQNGMETVKGF